MLNLNLLFINGIFIKLKLFLFNGSKFDKLSYLIFSNIIFN